MPNFTTGSTPRVILVLLTNFTIVEFVNTNGEGVKKTPPSIKTPGGVKN